MNLFNIMQKYFVVLDETMPNSDLVNFSVSSRSDIISYHYTIGTWIRNHFLQEGELLYQEFIDLGLKDKDEMSYLFLQMYYNYRQQFINEQSAYRITEETSLIERLNQRYPFYHFFLG